MDIRASRCAIWKLHAPPSREADINPSPKKGGFPAPHRVTFLTGLNRDFPKWRRQTRPQYPWHDQIGGAVHAFRILRNSTTKATDHELQKYDNFTRYGQPANFPANEARPGAAVTLTCGWIMWRLPPTRSSQGITSGCPDRHQASTPETSWKN